MPSINNFITCEPPARLPTQPNNANFQMSGPCLLKNSDTIPWLPGGKNSVKSRIVSSRSARVPSQLDPSPTASRSVGKNAKNTLNAIAWEIMPQRGNTRSIARQSWIRKLGWPAIAKHYSHVCILEPETLRLRVLERPETPKLFPFSVFYFLRHRSCV